MIAPPFRAEVIGSLLRPRTLKDTATAIANGKATAADYQSVLEREIGRVVTRQEELGLRVATDGELGRTSWFGFFFEGLDGFRLKPSLFRFRDTEGGSFEWPTCVATAPIRRRAPIALAQEMVHALDQRATETADAAQFTETYSDARHVLLHSEQRSDAVALEGLLRVQPQHALVPKVAKGLLADRKRGRWSNTQDNVFSAVALRAYFDAHERETPDLLVHTFVGKLLAQSARHQGRTANQTSTLVPMAVLAQAAGKQRGPVVVQKAGQGRLYYRLGLRYAPKSLALRAENQGFEVERSYQPIDAADDVTRDAAGTWYVKAGARIRVRVQMVVKARRHHVALVDPLAAGFEPVQSSLHVTSGQLPSEGPEQCPTCIARKPPMSLWGPWYEHENLRDDRAEAFSSLLDAGVHDYSHVVRATTPGEFIVPPAKAEEMYSPETFGRGATDRVIVR